MNFKEIAAIALDEVAWQDGDDFDESVITEDAGDGIIGKLEFDLQKHDERFHGGHFDGSSICKYRERMANAMTKAGIKPETVKGLGTLGGGQTASGQRQGGEQSEAEKKFLELKSRYEKPRQTEVSREEFKKARQEYLVAELGEAEAECVAKLEEAARSDGEKGEKAEAAADRILNDPKSTAAQKEGAQAIKDARKELKVGGKTYVDVSGMSFWDGMKEAFKAGFEGKEIVTDWDKTSGRWDAIVASDPNFKEENGLLQEGVKDALAHLGFGEDFERAQKIEGLSREQWQEIGYLKYQYDQAESAKDKHAAWRELKKYLSEQGLEKEKKGGKKDIGLKEPPKDITLPPETVLDPPVGESANKKYGDECKAYLETELKKFGANATIPADGVHVGPLSTEIVFDPGADFNYAKLRNGNVLDNITHGLKAKGRVIVEAKDDGSGLWSIKVSNPKRAFVTFNDIHDTKDWKDFAKNAAVPLMFGKDATTGEIIKADLAKLPHMIIGGATGQGKSVGLNTIVNGITVDKQPEDVQLILCDPKRTEFTGYRNDPHLAMPVLTNPADIAGGVAKLRAEMYRRMDLLGLDEDGAEAEQNSARSLDDYNRRVGKNERLPRQVLIIDELAEATADKSVGDALKADLKSVLALGRALGIHVICATQRSDVNAIPGDLKNNMPARMAFRTATGIDSRTILDETGAENLTGDGDFLFKDGRGNKIRGQGAKIDDEEINRIQDFYRTGKATESPKRGGGGGAAPEPAPAPAPAPKPTATQTASVQQQGGGAANGAGSSTGNTAGAPSAGGATTQGNAARPQQTVQPGQTVTNLSQSQVKRAEAMTKAQEDGVKAFLAAQATNNGRTEAKLDALLGKDDEFADED